MLRSSSLTRDLATALRDARRARKVSIASLAAEAGVSPRLVSEFERHKRPHVSLETALRLLSLVEVAVVPVPIMDDAETREARARAARAERRRATWTGFKGTLSAQDAPPAPSDAVARLAAVAEASRLAIALQGAASASCTVQSRRSGEADCPPTARQVRRRTSDPRDL
jgi:predicted transcriptional regulator